MKKKKIISSQTNYKKDRKGFYGISSGGDSALSLLLLEQQDPQKVSSLQRKTIIRQASDEKLLKNLTDEQRQKLGILADMETKETKKDSPLKQLLQKTEKKYGKDFANPDPISRNLFSEFGLVGKNLKEKPPIFKKRDISLSGKPEAKHEKSNLMKKSPYENSSEIEYKRVTVPISMLFKKNKMIGKINLTYPKYIFEGNELDFHFEEITKQVYETAKERGIIDTFKALLMSKNKIALHKTKENKKTSEKSSSDMDRIIKKLDLNPKEQILVKEMLQKLKEEQKKLEAEKIKARLEEIIDKKLEEKLMEKFRYYILLSHRWMPTTNRKDTVNLCIFILWAFLLDDCTDNKTLFKAKEFLGDKPELLEKLLDKFMLILKGEKIPETKFSEPIFNNPIIVSLENAVRQSREILIDHDIPPEWLYEVLRLTFDSKITEAKHGKDGVISPKEVYINIKSDEKLSGIGIDSAGTKPIEALIEIIDDLFIHPETRNNYDYKKMEVLMCLIIRIFNDIWSFHKEFLKEDVMFNYVTVILREWVAQHWSKKNVTMEDVKKYLKESGAEIINSEFGDLLKDLDKNKDSEWRMVIEEAFQKGNYVGIVLRDWLSNILNKIEITLDDVREFFKQGKYDELTCCFEDALKIMQSYDEDPGLLVLEYALKKAAYDHNRCLDAFYKLFQQYEAKDHVPKDKLRGEEYYLDSEIYYTGVNKKQLIEEHAKWLLYWPKVLKNIKSRYLDQKLSKKK